MTTQIVKSIIENKINYSLFNSMKLNDEQIELIRDNLESKIIKNNDKTLKKILEKNKENNEKYIIIIINILIKENGYTIKEINKIINRVKTMYELMEEEKEYKNININEIINEINIKEKENSINYIKKITEKQYKVIIEYIKNNEGEQINELLKILIEPYIQYKIYKSEKYVTDDIILEILIRIKKDKNIIKKDKKEIEKKIINYILETDESILNILLKKNKISEIISYLQNITIENEKIKEFKKKFEEKKENKIRTIIIPKAEINRQNEIKEIMNIIEELKLKIFLKNELGYEKELTEKIINNLMYIKIYTYERLEEVILKNIFIKKCRNESGKILPGKIIKEIIFKILEKNNKLIINKKQIKDTKDFDFYEIIINNKKETNEIIDNKEEKEENNIKILKEQRKNLRNLIILLKESNEETEKYEKELKEMEEKIKKEYLELKNVELMEEEIEEMTEYLGNNNLTEYERYNIEITINKYRKLIKNEKDNFEKSFEIEENINNNNTNNNNLTKIIEKYEKEEKEIEKENKKNEFIKYQKEYIEKNLKYIIKNIDKTFNTEFYKSIEIFIEFFKLKINNEIIKYIYQNFILSNNKFNNNEIVYKNIKVIFNTFMIILLCNSKNINIDKIYDSLDNIINPNEKIKKVIINQNQQIVELIEQIGEYYIVNYANQEIKLHKNEITIVNDIVGKEITIKKGNYKNFIGIIISQHHNYVLATKDLYGCNHNITNLPRVNILKLKFDEFSINKENNTQNFIINNKELYNYFETKDKSLFALTKFQLNKLYSIEELINFEHIYKLSIDLFNDYKKSQLNHYKTLRTMKIDYLSKKKSLNNIIDKNTYISLSKEIKKLHFEIKNMEKINKIPKIELFNNKSNLNPFFNYQIVDDIYLLKEYSISNNNNLNKNKKKRKFKNKKFKVDKKYKSSLINDTQSQLNILFNSLSI